MLVAGGAGFIGRHLVAHLVRDGASVVVLDNFSSASRSPFPAGVELIEHDITRHLPDVGPVDAVVHLASAASPRDFLRMPIETLLAGSVGTHNLLELARRSGARFVLASTSEVYGDPQVSPQTESYWGNVNPVGPRSSYDEAKRFAEALSTAYSRTHGVSVGIARIFNCYGPGLRRDDGRAVPTFITQALAGEPITVAGDGSQTRSPVFVDDLVAGLVALISSDVSGPVNLGSTQQVTMLDLALRIRSLVGSPSEVRYMPLPEDDPTNRLPDVSRARAELGWTATTDLDEGLARTIEWFRSAKH